MPGDDPFAGQFSGGGFGGFGNEDDFAPSGGGRRKARMESMLRREIATTVATELRDPRLGFITITRCELTEDFDQVTAYYTILGGDGSSRGLVEQALRSARGYVQRSYAKSVRMRRLPRLAFAYDEVEVQRQDMDDLIRRARASDPDGGNTPTPPTDAP